MADAPVGGRDSGTEKGKPARIPVSEPPEVDPDGIEPEDVERDEVEQVSGDSGREKSEEPGVDGTSEPAAAAEDEPARDEPDLAEPAGGEPVSEEPAEDESARSQERPEPAVDKTLPMPDADKTLAMPKGAVVAGEPEEGGSAESADEPETENLAAAAPAAEPETEDLAAAAPAAEPETQDLAASKPAGKSAFDMFAPKNRSAASAASAESAAARTPAPAAPAQPAPAPIPVSEAPDLEAEAEAAEAEALAERGADADLTTPMRTPVAPVSSAAEASEDTDDDESRPAPDNPAPDNAADQTVVVPSDLFDQEAEPEPDAETTQSPAEPPPLNAEADETTLIPKVPEHITESTTVMPLVASPRSSDMARRPYTSAPAGYGSARQAWGGDEHDGPDAQPTQLQAQVPGTATAAGKRDGKKGGYQPPEFHRVDPTRSQLPPPQNFKLDRRELDENDGSGKHLGRRSLLVGGGVLVAAAAGLTAAGVIKLPGTAQQPPTVGFAPATNSGASSATQTGTAFLNAWQNGEFEVAANITDNPSAALSALQAYKKNLGVVGMVVNPNAANAVGWMTYAVTMQGGTPMGQWQYDSGFAAYSKQIDGYVRWFVKWDPSILYTSLKPGYELRITRTPATVKGLVDRNNQPIDATAHPSLAGIINTLVSKAKATGATDGQNIIMVDAKGKQQAMVAVLTPPINNGTVATTLDMKVQAAAESAVTQAANSSIVAIQPSTGHILAIANHTGSQYYDDALLAGVAPGSTFKIITSTALLDKGMTSLDSHVPCPATITIDSTVLHNSDGETGDGYSYEQDFAVSCNNAFSSFWDVSGMTGDLLSDTAKKYYGLNQKWDIGVGESAQYMTIPSGLSRGDLAESLVGQAKIQSCPLAMCSVAATVATGSFKQPILLPKQQQVTATPLGSSLQGKLKTLMASVVSSGTAQGIFPDNGHFFGKTGTAEYGPTGSPKNNSWFVVFNDTNDLAVCALAIDGGFGATTAAPECQTVFKKLGYI